MNDNRRIRLKESCAMLQTAMATIQSVKEEEQNSLDNVPENLQNSELYIEMESAIDALEEAAENVEQATISVYNAL